MLHLIAGTMTYAVMLAYYLVVGEVTACTLIGSLLTCCAVGCAAEAKDLQAGNTWDWLDLLATVLVPIITTIVGIIILLIW